MESYDVIKSSVKELVPIPSESEGILDNMCDVPFSDKNHFDEFTNELVHIDPIPPRINETDSDPKDDIRFIGQLLYDDTSSEDDSFENVDYVEASPLDFKLVRLEDVKDEILHAKLLNIHLLIAKIESLNDSSTPDCVLKSPYLSFLSYSDNSLPEFKTFSDHTKETSSGSITTHVDNSLPEYDSFLFKIEPDQESPFLLSSRSEDIILDPDISVFHFSSLEPVAFKCPMKVCSSTCFVPNITMISGESS
nr:hypothetical protein [Tanacetum cinerariifolium]